MELSLGQIAQQAHWNKLSDSAPSTLKELQSEAWEAAAAAVSKAVTDEQAKAFPRVLRMIRSMQCTSHSKAAYQLRLLEKKLTGGK